MSQSAEVRAYTQSFYRHNHVHFILAILLIVMSTGGMLYFSWAMGEVTNIMAAGDLHRLWDTLGITVAALAATLVVELLMYYFKTRFVHQALRQYKDYAFSRLLDKRISAFSRETTNRYLSALTNDANSIEENYLNRSILLIYQGAMFVGGLAMMLVLSWQLALATMALSLIPMVSSLAMSRGLAKREVAMSDQNERFVAQVKDVLTGFSVIKSFKAEGTILRLLQANNGQTECAKERRRRWDAILGAVTQTCGTALQVGVFFYGAWLAICGHIQMGTVLITLNLVNCFTQPIQIVPQYWASRKAALALIRKLAEITQENAAQPGKAIPPSLRSSIVLDHVSFGFDRDCPVLWNLSARFEAGKRYAIVGASGAGKSTLLNLLMGSYRDYSGSISIDGQELREVDTDSLYDLMSLIGQHVFLFDDTIRNNLTLFQEFPDDQVEIAVKRSGLSELVAQHGANYRCGENGMGLSGGERQRVSIARALLRGTPVLLLDEATAALDNQTAYEVTDAILHLDGLTRIVVTHRLDPSLMAQYDQILVLQGGQIREQGNYADLMSAKGCFYSLCTLTEGAPPPK